MTGAVYPHMRGFASHLSLGLDSPELRQEVKWSLTTHPRDRCSSSLALHQGLVTPHIPKLLWTGPPQMVTGEQKKTNQLFCVLWSAVWVHMCKRVCVHVCVSDVCETRVCVVGTSRPRHRARRKSYQEAVMTGSTN